VLNPTPGDAAPSQTSGALRLSDLIVKKFTQAFEKASIAAGGERILWEVFPMAAPSPMNPGQILTGLAVYCVIPSTLVGQSISITVVVEGGLVEADQKVVDGFVKERTDELFAARSREVELAHQQAAQAQAAGNGSQPPESGLFVPNR
jgi:hypothetical protein